MMELSSGCGLREIAWGCGVRGFGWVSFCLFVGISLSTMTVSRSYASPEVWKDLDGLVHCQNVGVAPEQIYPQLAGDEVQETGVMAIPLETLRKAYWVEHPNATQVTVHELLADFGVTWVPVYFRPARWSTDEETVIATGILSETQVAMVADRVNQLSLKSSSSEALGTVVLFRDLVPDHLRTREVLIRLTDGEVLGWPHLAVSGDLNIPAFTWRLTLESGPNRPLLAEWPVVVGKTTTKTPRTVGLVYCTMLHHYPPWTDPETKKYVGPGKHNPLGIWKLMPTEPKKVIWYYHGTNQPKLLNRTYRAFSHGCIRNRNENIAHLALFMLTRNSGVQLPTGQLAGNLDVYGETRTRLVPLFASVPAANRYHCLDVVQNTVTGEAELAAYPDVYWFRSDDGKTHRTVNSDYLSEKLTALGFDTAKLAPTDVAVFAKQLSAIKQAVRYPVSQLKLILTGGKDTGSAPLAETAKVKSVN